MTAVTNGGSFVLAAAADELLDVISRFAD